MIRFLSGRSRRKNRLKATRRHVRPVVQGLEERLLLAGGGGGGSMALGVEPGSNPSIVAPIPVPLPLPASETDLTAVAGTALIHATVATFTSSRVGAKASDFTARIDWGDGQVSTGSVQADPMRPTVYNVRNTHFYYSKGSFAVTVTLVDQGGTTSGGDDTGTTVTPDYLPSAPATATGLVVAVTTRPVTATGAVVQGIERQPITWALAYSSIPIGLTLFDFSATVDWGDGSGVQPGEIFAPGHGLVLILGDHSYAGSGVYTIQVVITVTGGQTIPVQSTAVVADDPISPTITALLDPGSDSGPSVTDAITSLPTPTYRGTVQPGATLSLIVQAVGSAAMQVAGTTQADAAGNWVITSRALADGAYTVIIQATDPADNSVGVAALPALVIDTVGPRVAGFTVDRAHGRFAVSFTTGAVGLDLPALLDPVNYRIQPTRRGAGRLAVSGLAVAVGPTTTTVSGRLNGGRSVPAGLLNLLVRSGPGGIRDQAGNALDGEFVRAGVSGNGLPGGDYTARLVAQRRLDPIPAAPATAPAPPHVVKVRPTPTSRVRRALVPVHSGAKLPQLGR